MHLPCAGGRARGRLIKMRKCGGRGGGDAAFFFLLMLRDPVFILFCNTNAHVLLQLRGTLASICYSSTV